MSKILIFQTPDTDGEERKILGTTNEKSIIYENLINKLRNIIDEYHFKQFISMETQVLKSEKTVSRGIPPILAKELIKYIKPLIVEIPENAYKKEIPSKMKKKNVEEKIKLDKWHLSLQNEYPIHGILYPITAAHEKKYEKLKFKNIIIPQNTPFKIVGFALPNDLGAPMLDTSIFINSFTDDIAISNYNILQETGSYRLNSISNSKNAREDLYIQQFDVFEHTRTNYKPELDIEFLNKKKKTNASNRISMRGVQSDDRLRAVVFKNDDDALIKMNIILDELNRVRSYYIKNYASVFKTIEFNPLKKLDMFKRKKIIISVDKSPVSDKLLSMINEILPGETITNTKDSIYFALKNKGFLEMFNKLKILGTGNSKVQQEYHIAKLRSEIDKILEYQNRIRTSYLLELLKKQAITANKFGSDRKYTDLKSNDRTAVNNEYNKIIEEERASLEDQSSKKKEEIKSREMAIRQFYNAFNSLKKQQSLKEALVGLKNVGISTDVSTLKYGLCIHNLVKAKMIIAGDRDKQIKDHIISKYTHIDHTKGAQSDLAAGIGLDISSDYYCNICGEKVYINIVEDSIKFVRGQLIVSEKEYDALGDLIYKEVSYTIRGVVRFKTDTDTRPIVKSLATVLRPEIGIIESRLLKIRTNIGDDIRDLITLYINIYTYALISRMIFLSPGNITFAQRPKYKPKPDTSGFKSNAEYKQKMVSAPQAEGKKPKIKKIGKGGYKKIGKNFSWTPSSNTSSDDEQFSKFTKGGKADIKNRLQNIIASAYQLLISTKINNIKKIVTIKLENILPFLLKAYKWVCDLDIVNSDADYVGSTGSKGDIVDNAINSPIYKYLYHMRHVLHGTDKEDLNTILGRSLVTIEKNIQEKDVFNNVPQVTEEQFANYVKKSFSNLTTELYTKLIIKIMYNSYKNTMDYISTDKYKESLVPLSSVLSDHYKSWDDILDMQTSIIYMNMISKYMPIYLPNYYKFKDRFEYDPSLKMIDISKLYRKNGYLHKWDIYVFKKNQGSATKEINVKELNNMLKNNQNFHKDYKLLDRKDSETGEYLSKIRDYSSEIKKNIKKMEILENFFEYFENRCPETGLHIADDNKKCTKCGMVLTFKWKKSSSSFSNERDKYYKKYSYIFDKQIKERDEVTKKGLQEIEKEKDIALKSNLFKDIENKKDPKLFRLNEAKILDWSRKSKISFNVLINLGLSERFKFEKIEKGEINPLKSEDVIMDDMGNRTLKLDGYYNNIIYQYYLIKGYTSSYDLPHELNELIDKLSSSKGLQASMKEIYNPEYHAKFTYFLHINKNPHDINNFILNQLANILLNIVSSTEKTKFSTFGLDLFKFFTNEIINREKLFSKPDPFKYKIDKRAELGNDYASDSSNIDSSAGDFISTDEFRSSTQSGTDTDVLEKEDNPVDTLENFAFEESDITERNDGGDDDPNE